MSAETEPLVCSLGRLAAAAGGRAGLCDSSREFTLARCSAAVRGGARWLLDLGLRPGDRVALFGENSITFSVAYFAIHAAGGIAVPIGSDVSAESVRQALEDCAPSLVLAENPSNAAAPAARTLPAPEQWAASDAPFEPRCSGENPADLLFTTGTTGSRKGVLLSHGNIASAATNINAFVGTLADDIEVVPIPLSHSFGLGRLRWRRLVGIRFAEVGTHVRYLELGSAALSPEDRRFLIETLPTTRICHHYGLTEASRAAFCELHRDWARPDCIGRPAPNVEIRIADEQGRSLPASEVGEILVRGDMVMQGYWQQPELTSSTLRDGWFRSGDEGWMDDDGYLYLRGRKGDVINVGGLKVAPHEIERRLCEIPGVREAACIGAPDPRGVLGQVVKAFIVSDAEPSELGIAERLRRVLPEHELPRLFERVAALPKTESGKIKRAELRAREVR